MISKRFAISIIMIVSIFVSAKAQDFFSDQAQDTIPKGFYELSYKATALVTADVKNGYWYGATIMKHFNKEQFSPLLSFYIKPNDDANVEGVKASIVKSSKAQDSVVYSKTDTVYSYRSYVVSFGMAASPYRNVLLYAQAGIRFTKNEYSFGVVNGYYFKKPNNQVELYYAAGAMYVLNNGITIQAGLDLSKFGIITGIGYTF